MDEVPVPPAAVEPVQLNEPVIQPQPVSQTAADVASEISASSTFLCPQCHFAVKPEYYYCPNCGKNLRSPALSTDVMSQVLLYGFSIVLPMIAYLAITKWQGIKYIRSSDEKAKQMGYIALLLIIVSSILFFWWSIVQLQGFVQSSLNSSLSSGCGGLC